MRSEDTVLVRKYLEFCQTLFSQGQHIYFSLTIGSKFSFSLDARQESPNLETRKKSSNLETKSKKSSREDVVRKKKLSPSEVNRNLKRKEAFLKNNLSWKTNCSSVLIVKISTSLKQI